MTDLLDAAFLKTSKLSESQQNVIAKWLLDEIDSGNLWDKIFAESENLRGQSADKGLTEFEEERTGLLHQFLALRGILSEDKDFDTEMEFLDKAWDSWKMKESV